MANDETTQDMPENEKLSDDIKLIIVGVAQLVIVCVPILLIHTLRKRIEQSKAFKNIEGVLG